MGEVIEYNQFVSGGQFVNILGAIRAAIPDDLDLLDLSDDLEKAVGIPEGLGKALEQEALDALTVDPLALEWALESALDALEAQG